MRHHSKRRKCRRFQLTLAKIDYLVVTIELRMICRNMLSLRELQQMNNPRKNWRVRAVPHGQDEVALSSMNREINGMQTNLKRNRRTPIDGSSKNSVRNKRPEVLAKTNKPLQQWWVSHVLPQRIPTRLCRKLDFEMSPNNSALGCTIWEAKAMSILTQRWFATCSPLPMTRNHRWVFRLKL